MKIERIDIAGLTTRIVGDGKTTVVLLHGFGAPGDDLVALAQFIRVPGVRFVFPAAPLELGGLYGDARAWWRLDLANLERDLRSGAERDRRAEIPEGLDTVRQQVLRFLEQVEARFALEPANLVLGGFSQGAMLSLDVALHREGAVGGLILMSGTLLAESIWKPQMAKLAGVSVFQSHGRDDQLLPFSIAQTLRDELKAAGANVTWIEFAGGHEIPPHVLDGVSKLIGAIGNTSR